jgi:Arc/MetJ family transcription regulator
MRTNIEIDDKLMKAAMRATGATTKKGAVEAAMQVAVQLHKQGEAIGKLWGLGWEGNLDEMRRSKHLDWDHDWKAASKTRRNSAA